MCFYFIINLASQLGECRFSLLLAQNQDDFILTEKFRKKNFIFIGFYIVYVLFNMLID